MGVRFLNNYLLKKCSKESGSIKKASFNILEGKTITIDASIYIYKFLKLGKLADKMHDFMRLCLYYKVTPIFVFDGKPPIEKLETIKKRKIAHMAAATNPDATEAIIMTKEHVDIVKKIISTYKFEYMNAPSEADALCAQLVHKNIAWACFSDDMDMFVYGCPRIIRELNMKTHTFMIYDMETILNTLNITQVNLTYLCILCGTDYTLSGIIHQFVNEETQLSHFNQVNRLYDTWKTCDEPIEFIDWVCKTYDEYKQIKPEIEKIYYMFSSPSL